MALPLLCQLLLRSSSSKMRCSGSTLTLARRDGPLLSTLKVLPWLGARIADDADSYRYLAESIRMHPDQRTLATMFGTAGFERVQVFNLTAGVVALHEGVKL